MSLSGLGADRLRASNDRIVVTGGSGWIGRAALELLHDTLGPSAFAARVKSYGSTARSLTLRPGLSIMQQPLTEIGDLPSRPTLLLHTAFVTLDRARTMAEADYVAANEAIRAKVLAAIDAIGVVATFVPSSGAVHAGAEAASAMRLYGELKRADEAAFAAAGRTVVARVFNLSGRHINKHSSYALASFIGDALAGQPIAIHADRPVVRSYVPVAELLSVALGLLPGDETPAAFDTAGAETFELGEVADIVSRVVAKTTIARPPIGTDAADTYVGDRAQYATHLAALQISEISFEDQVRDTADFLSETRSMAA